MKTPNIYNLQAMAEAVACGVTETVWEKINALQCAFSQFSAPAGAFTIMSTAGEAAAKVEVSYEVDSDGDVCNVKVWGAQGEVTDYLSGNDLSRIEEECNLASHDALIERRHESRIDAYLANQE